MLVTIKTVLLFIAISSCASIFAAASISPLPDCAPPDDQRIRLLARNFILSGLPGGIGDPIVTILEYHFTCMAVGSTEGTFRSLSYVVRSSVMSRKTSEPVQLIAQILLICQGRVGDRRFISADEGGESNQPESLFNLTTRRDCLLCATSGSPTIDQPTNCAGKSNMMLKLSIDSHHLLIISL